MFLFLEACLVADKLSSLDAPTAKFRRRIPIQTVPRRQLPVFDASIFALQGPRRTTGFRRRRNRRQNSENRKQKRYKTEASKPGSLDQRES
jgi:hypothetical protein